MKPFRILFSLFFVSFLLACAAHPEKGGQQPKQSFAVEGTILEGPGSKLTLSVNTPDFSKSTDSVVEDIANQVVRKSYLLEGTKLTVDGREGLVTEVRGNQMKMTFEQPLAYTSGRKVSVQVPKKTIAVVDFEVLGGNRKEKGRVVLEGLTSALIETGQFIVVERAKLQTVMNEIQLSQSGLTRPEKDGLAGKLFSADLILTGTLTDLQDEWEINLRILNVRTGQAVSAVAMKTKLFRQMEMRDSGPWIEDFEGASVDPTWLIRFGSVDAKKSKKHPFNVQLDTTAGAGDSRQSLRIDFDFTGEQDFYAMAKNQKKRDLTLYTGAEFFIKSATPVTGQFFLTTSHPEDPNKIDMWTGMVAVDQTWKKVRVPFHSMTAGRIWIRKGAERTGAKPGDQVIRLNRVESVLLGIGSDLNDETSGSLWIDKIRFYND